jgi:hypothetical protein
MQTKGIREEKEKRRKSCVYGKKETKERWKKAKKEEEGEEDIKKENNHLISQNHNRRTEQITIEQIRSSGDACDLYFGGDRFESLLGHWLLTEVLSEWYVKFDHYRFLPYPF